MIGFRISDFAEVEAEVMRRASFVPQAVATEASRIISDNSAAGKDIKGRKFLPYSKEYKKFRSKHGLSNEPPNLRVSGHLLDLQKTRVEGMKSSVAPSATDTLIAEGLNYKYQFYPEQDDDILPSFNGRIVKAGEEAMSAGK